MAQAYPFSARAGRIPVGGMAAFKPGTAPTEAELSAGRGVLQGSGDVYQRPAFIPSGSDPVPLADVFPDAALLSDILSGGDPVGDVVHEVFPDAPAWVAPALSTAAHLLAPEEMGIFDLLWMAYQLTERQPVYGSGGDSGGGLPPSWSYSPPSGWDVILNCGMPNQNLLTTTTSNTCYTWVSTGPAAQIDWATASQSGRVKWFGPGTGPDVSGFYHYGPAQEWHYSGVYPIPPSSLDGPPSSQMVSLSPDLKPRGALTPGQLSTLLPYTAPLSGASAEAIPWRFVSRETTPFHETGPAPVWRALPLATEALRLATLTPPSPWGQTVPQPWIPPQVGSEVEPELFQQLLRRLQDEARESDPKRRLGPFPSSSDFVRFEPPSFGPPKLSVVCEKKIRIPKALVHGLAASTYAGGTIRNLFRSLPRHCKSYIRPGRHRRYSSMLSDVYRCWNQLDQAKFMRLEAEMLLKYAAEGYALAQMNAVSRYLWQGALCRPVISGTGGLGLGTAVMHTTAPSGDQSSYGGAFGNRQSRFGLVDLGQQKLDQWLSGQPGVGSR